MDLIPSSEEVKDLNAGCGWIVHDLIVQQKTSEVLIHLAWRIEGLIRPGILRR